MINHLFEKTERSIINAENFAMPGIAALNEEHKQSSNVKNIKQAEGLNEFGMTKNNPFVFQETNEKSEEYLKLMSRGNNLLIVVPCLESAEVYQDFSEEYFGQNKEVLLLSSSTTLQEFEKYVVDYKERDALIVTTYHLLSDIYCHKHSKLLKENKFRVIFDDFHSTFLSKFYNSDEREQVNRITKDLNESITFIMSPQIIMYGYSEMMPLHGNC